MTNVEPKDLNAGVLKNFENEKEEDNCALGVPVTNVEPKDLNAGVLKN